MICPDCKKDRSPEEFPIARREKTGRHRYCKNCHKKRCLESVIKHHGGRGGYLTKYRYGITEEEKKALLFAQGGLCAICGSAKAEHVDHDHGSGEVRGVLCFNCNGGLGRFQDDAAVMEAAMAYLQAHGATGA